MANQKRSFIQSPFLKIGAGILFIAILALMFLPQISSTTWFNNTAKKFINEKIPGKVDYDQLNISWLNGLRINEIVYEDQSQGTRLTVDEISTSKGLLSFVTNSKDAGIISIKTPQATILTEKQQPALNKAGTTSDKIASAKTTEAGDSQKKDSSDSTPLLPPIHVQLHISDGSLVTVSADDSKKTVIEKLNVQLNLDVPNGAVDYQLSFQDGLDAGKINGKGNIKLPGDTLPDLDNLKSDAILEIQNWQIADILTLAASRSNAPQGEGIIDGLLEITGSGKSTIGVTGNLKGHAIQLHGGPFSTDKPTIDDFNVDLDIQKIDDRVEIKKLNLGSPFIQGVVTGTTSGNTLKTLSTDAKINVAEILSQLPHTLNLQEGINLSEGLIDVKADLSSAGTTTSFNANAHLNRLAGSAGDKKISWKKPVDITVQGNLDKEALTLKQFTVDSSFLQANGSGNAEEIQLKLAADIGSALQELEKFIHLDGWGSDGKLNLDVNVTSKSREIKEIKGNINIAKFELHHNKTVISPSDTFSTVISSTLHLTPEMVPSKISDTKIDMSSWLGKSTISADSFTPKTKDSPVIINNSVIESTLNLDRITTLLHSLKTLPQEQSFAGTLDMIAKMDGEQLDKSTVDFQANVSPFTFINDGKSLTDKNVGVALKGEVNLPEKSITIKDLNLTSTPVALTAKGSLQPEKKELMALAQGTTKFDFKALSNQLNSFSDIQLEMSGISEKPFTFEAKSTNGAWTNIAQHAKFTTSLQVDKITGYGLDIESLGLPVRLMDSIAEIDLTAKVNRGVLAIKPKIDLTGSAPIVTLPENSTILKKVGLTSDLSNDLLAKIHPLFKGVSSTAGTLNLDMQHFNWPTDKELQKDIAFAGALTFNDVKLQAGAVLTPLLAIMKTDEDEIQISKEPMTFVGQNGRVTCSPLEATVNTYSIILEGSVGFDQSLDYTAKIPVTRKMVSGDVYKYLEGTFITVPLTGTVSKPSVSKSVVQNALGDLIMQAGKKQLGDQAGKLLQKLFQ